MESMLYKHIFTHSHTHTYKHTHSAGRTIKGWNPHCLLKMTQGAAVNKLESTFSPSCCAQYSSLKQILFCMYSFTNKKHTYTLLPHIFIKCLEHA